MDNLFQLLAAANPLKLAAAAKKEADGGDKEKMECFVDFCEDAIFEMQHSASLVEEDSDEGKVGGKINQKSDHHLVLCRLSGNQAPRCQKKMSQKA